MSAPEINDTVATVNDLKRRVLELEQSPRLVGALPRGTSLEIVAPDGTTVAFLGTTSSGEMLVYLGQNGSALTWTRSNGLTLPYEHVPVLPVSQGFKDITNATYEAAWYCNCEYVQTYGKKITFIVGADAGTTGNVRIRNVTSGTNSTAQSIAAASASTYICYWNDTSLALYGGPVLYEIQVQRTGGAGTLHVYPVTFTMGSFTTQDPTNVGTWSVV